MLDGSLARLRRGHLDGHYHQHFLGDKSRHHLSFRCILQWVEALPGNRPYLKCCSMTKRGLDMILRHTLILTLSTIGAQ